MHENTNGISLEALLAGNQAEFSRVVDAYSGPIYRIALNLLTNAGDKTFQHLKDFEDRSCLSTWLYRIATNEAFMMIRKHRPEVNRVDLQPMDQEDYDYSPVQQRTGAACPKRNCLLPNPGLYLIRRSSAYPKSCASFLSCANFRDCPSREPPRCSA